MSERDTVYAGLSARASALAGMVTALCDSCEDAELFRTSGKVAMAARLLNEATEELRPPPPVRAGRRWRA